LILFYYIFKKNLQNKLSLQYITAWSVGLQLTTLYVRTVSWFVTNIILSTQDGQHANKYFITMNRATNKPHWCKAIELDSRNLT